MKEIFIILGYYHYCNCIQIICLNEKQQRVSFFNDYNHSSSQDGFDDELLQNNKKENESSVESLTIPCNQITFLIHRN